MPSPHIVLAGEGGHSHLLSGLAVAEALVRCLPDAAITFVGSGRPIDRHAVRERGFAYIAIPSQPPPQGPLEAFRFLAENVVGYWASRWILREQQVSLVIGFGGLTSGVMSRAAVARGLPTMLLEQNAVPSRITRWFARSAAAICTSFAETASLLPPDARVHLTGFPVPAAIASLADTIPAACRPAEMRQRRMLVLGGNFGAASLNQVVPPALGRLRRQLAEWHLVHQTGAGQLQAVETRYQAAGIDALAVCFIDELAHVLGETDLAVCRPGGTTLAELAAAGVPALLLPHPDAADDYHLANAQHYASAGGCRLLDERTCEGHLEEGLAGELDALLKSGAGRAEMATAMRGLSHPGAAHEIAALAFRLLDSGVDSVPLAA